eukprot:gene10911-2985_t
MASTVANADKHHTDQDSMITQLRPRLIVYKTQLAKTLFEFIRFESHNIPGKSCRNTDFVLVARDPTLQEQLEELLIGCFLTHFESPLRHDKIVVYPERKPWPGAALYRFFNGSEELVAEPSMIVLHVRVLDEHSRQTLITVPLSINQEQSQKNPQGNKEKANSKRRTSQLNRQNKLAKHNKRAKRKKDLDQPGVQNQQVASEEEKEAEAEAIETEQNNEMHKNGISNENENMSTRKHQEAVVTSSKGHAQTDMQNVQEVRERGEDKGRPKNCDGKDNNVSNKQQQKQQEARVVVTEPSEQHKNVTGNSPDVTPQRIMDTTESVSSVSAPFKKTPPPRKPSKLTATESNIQYEERERYLLQKQ